MMQIELKEDYLLFNGIELKYAKRDVFESKDGKFLLSFNPEFAEFMRKRIYSDIKSIEHPAIKKIIEVPMNQLAEFGVEINTDKEQFGCVLELKVHDLKENIDKTAFCVISPIQQISVDYTLAFKNWDTLTDEVQEAIRNEVPDPIKLKNGKLECQCKFKGCSHYGAGNCKLIDLVMNPDELGYNKAQKCLFDGHGNQHYLCCPRRINFLQRNIINE